MKTITIRYKCQCMQDEGTFEVRERGAGEDIAEFMHHVTRELGKAHGKISPLCRAAKTEYVKIPLPKSGGNLGEAEGGTA